MLFLTSKSAASVDVRAWIIPLICCKIKRKAQTVKHNCPFRLHLLPVKNYICPPFDSDILAPTPAPAKAIFESTSCCLSLMAPSLCGLHKACDPMASPKRDAETTGGFHDPIVFLTYETMEKTVKLSQSPTKILKSTKILYQRLYQLVQAQAKPFRASSSPCTSRLQKQQPGVKWPQHPDEVEKPVQTAGRQIIHNSITCGHSKEGKQMILGATILPIWNCGLNPSVER